MSVLAPSVGNQAEVEKFATGMLILAEAIKTQYLKPGKKQEDLNGQGKRTKMWWKHT